MRAPDDLRIAYVISAYKLPRQLIRLVNALDDQWASFVISVDRATNSEVYRVMTDGLANRRNVHFLPRKKSPYRSFGHVDSTLRAIAHLHGAGIRYDYVSLMTGQDLPIKPNGVIREFLRRRWGLAFLEWFPLPAEQWRAGGLDRLNRYFIHTRRRTYSISRRWLPALIPAGLPFDLAPFGGSGYWTLHRDHVEHVRRFVDENPRFVSFFRHTNIPDETFFHTILMNSDLSDRIVNDNLRYIDWSRRPAPAILCEADLEALKRAPELWARKFDETVDARIIDRVLDELT